MSGDGSFPRPGEEARIFQELQESIATSDDAVAILEGLASALFPPEKRDRDHLTWPDDPGRRRDDELDPEAQLRAAEARYRALVEQIPAVTFMAVLGEGENEVYVSPHVEQLLGYSQDEWLEDPFLWYWRLHPGDRQLWNQEFARGCQTGGPFSAECRFVARDGGVVWVHGEARIIRDERGRPQVLQGVAFDITEMKRAETLAVEQAKVAEELEIARRMQVSILPRDVIIPGLEIAATMEPAEEVGGDYYDLLPCDDGAWIGIGDVSGHGLNAGLFMMMVQSATSAAVASAPAGASPMDILASLSRVMYDNIRHRLQSEDYITFSLLRYFPDGRLQFGGAHLDLLVARAATGEVEQHATIGTWLGITPEVPPGATQGEVRLEVGDLLVVYTDGLTEAVNEDGEMFGIERLIGEVERSQSCSPGEVVERVSAAVDSWAVTHEDDRTLLVMRHRGSNAG